MKKAAVVLAVLVLVVAFGSLSFAADMGMQKGTIKSIDAKAGTVVFCAEGSDKDMTLKAGKGIDLAKVKAGDKVEVAVEKDMVTHLMAAPKAAPKAAVGC
jgi:hypothetical protein